MSKTVIARLVSGLDYCHTVEIAEEVRAPDFGGINTLVAEFAEEAPVAVVDGIGDTAEVTDIVVGSTSVDMVDSHTGRDGFVAPGDIDGMGSKDAFVVPPCVSESKIIFLAVMIVAVICSRSIAQFFASVGIDANADDAAVAVVGIERDVGFGVRADIGDPHVVKEER